MSDVIIVALIAGGFGLIGSLITAKSTSAKLSADVRQSIAVSQAVTDTKLEELTREVREHNNFAKRMPVVENDIKYIKDDLGRLHAYHK